MEISFSSHPNTNKGIATKFGTWHDSWAVVACAKCCVDIITSNWIRAKWNFHRIWIVMEKSLVKWVPDPCGLMTSLNNNELKSVEAVYIDNGNIGRQLFYQILITVIKIIKEMDRSSVFPCMQSLIFRVDICLMNNISPFMSSGLMLAYV